MADAAMCPDEAVKVDAVAEVQLPTLRCALLEHNDDYGLLYKLSCSHAPSSAFCNVYDALLPACYEFHGGWAVVVAAGPKLRSLNMTRKTIKQQ